MPYSVVITGGNGFVGRYLADELKRAWPGSKIVVWDLPDVDINNPDTYGKDLQTIKPDWLVHLAALAKVGASFNNSDEVRRINVEGTKILLKTIATLSPKTLVLAVSSADIYGGGGIPLAELPLSEINPDNPYAQSKADMERVIEELFNDRCIRVRPFPHIGPGQKRGFVTSDFAAQIASIERGDKPPVVTVGNLGAERDFTDVRDVVKAYRLLLEKGRVGEVYNIASGQAVSIQAILDKFLALSSVDISVKRDPNKMRPSDKPYLVGDSGKLKKETGWQSVIPLNRSLRDILNHWRKYT